jgi:hypothetical protein
MLITRSIQFVERNGARPSLRRHQSRHLHRMASRSAPVVVGTARGLDALKKVRDEDPATYARIFAALMPKQLEITDEDPISNLIDEQIEAYCGELERQIAERAARTRHPGRDLRKYPLQAY